MTKGKSPKSKFKDLDVSLDSKVSSSERQEQPTDNFGFDAVDRRMRASAGARATGATTVRLSEDSDAALRKASSEFGTSKADVIKNCVEEYLRAKKFLHHDHHTHS